MNKMGYYASLDHIALRKNNVFYENMLRDVNYLKYLDCDRMLYNFRKTFGVPTDAEPIYGWETPNGLLRGHSVGHYMSALAIAYSATGDEELLQKLNYMISELHALQKMSRGRAADFCTACTPDNCNEELWSKNPAVWGEGFLSAYSPDQFALLEQFARYADIWAPYYTLHKLLAGFVEAFERTGNKEALIVACGIGNWIYERLSPLSAERRKKMWSLYIAGEYGGMNETLARLYRITREKKYLICAKIFDNENIFPSLSKGEDAFKNLHANQHIPQIMGALLEYEVCEDEVYYSVARNFFHLVTERHLYSIGGVGQGESFREPNQQARFIRENTNCETCATYNLLKLARELYAFEPETATYMDYYERGMINHILASQNPRVLPHRMHGVTYMLPIGPGAQKEYGNDYWSFTCCHGTGMENHVKYPDAQYFISQNALYINQYIPSTLNCDGMNVHMDVSFPFGQGTIVLSGESDYVCKLRVPYWQTGNPFTDDLGRPLRLEGRYAVVRHSAGENTVIHTQFHYTVRWEATPDSLDGFSVASLLYGPFVMVTYDPENTFLTIPENAAFHAEINKEAGSFYLTGAGRIFIPIYQAHDKPYHAYFKLQKSHAKEDEENIIS